MNKPNRLYRIILAIFKFITDMQLLLVIFLMSIGSYLIYLPVVQYIANYEFATEGLSHTATIEKCWYESKSRNGNGVNYQYSYTLAGQKYQGTHWTFGTLTECERFPANTNIEIVYLPTDYTRSQVTTDGLANRDEGIILLLPLGIGILYVAMSGLRRDWQHWRATSDPRKKK